MNRRQRLRYRLSMLWAAIRINPLSPRLLLLAARMPPVAGASGEDEKVEINKAELDRLKREAAENGKSNRKLTSEVEDLKRKLQDATDKLDDASAGGDDAKKLQTQLAREKSKREAAEEKIKELEASIESGNQERTVTTVAARLGFRNPKVAMRLLDDDADVTDEAAAEKSLKALLKSEPYLKGPGKVQREVTGSDAGDEGGDQGEGDKGGERSKSEGKLTGVSRLANAYANTGKSGENKE